MIIEVSFELPVGRDQAAQALLDVDRIGECVPGVSGIRQTEDDAYEAQLSVAVGPIRSKFDGAISVDRSGAPEQLTARGSGRDPNSGSSASVDFVAKLHELAESRTRVDTVSDVTIRGRFGQFGTGVIRTTAEQMIRDFSRCVTASLAAGSADESKPEPGRPLRLIRAVAVGVFARAGRAVRSLFTRRH